MLNEKEVERIKKAYPSGTRIKLNYMSDDCGIYGGTLGIVDFVDDAGQIHMIWDNGRTIALIENEDSFEIVGEEKTKSMEVKI